MGSASERCSATKRRLPLVELRGQVLSIPEEYWRSEPSWSEYERRDTNGFFYVAGGSLPPVRVIEPNNEMQL